MKSLIKNFRTFLLLGAVVLCTTQAYAGRFQGPGGGGKRERVEALKIAFITQRLQLTSVEAEKFWPVFNAYEADLETLRKNYKPVEPNTITAEQRIEFSQKKLDLEKKYLPQVEAAIGKDKAATLYGLEEEFRKKLRDLAQERQQQRGGRWNK